MTFHVTATMRKIYSNICILNSGIKKEAPRVKNCFSGNVSEQQTLGCDKHIQAWSQKRHIGYQPYVYLTKVLNDT